MDLSSGSSDQSFDVVPVLPGLPSGVVELALVPPADLLSADKVAAVRFHPAKPGYSFAQVEAFVDQVSATLRFLEARMHTDDVALHEKRDELQYLQDKVTTLQATIEVFRANGDPVTNADGSYVTQSEMAEVASLRSENQTLAAQVAEAQAEAARAWDAEAELRRYVDETLMPWLEAAQAAQAAPVTTVEDSPVEDVLPASGQDVEPVVEPRSADDEVEILEVDAVPGVSHDSDEDDAAEADESEPAAEPSSGVEVPAPAQVSDAEPMPVDAAHDVTPHVEPVSWSLLEADEEPDVRDPEPDIAMAVEPSDPVEVVTGPAPVAEKDSWDDAPSVSVDVPAGRPASSGPSVSARLASSPEVAALGDDVDLDDLVDPSELDEVAPRAAGAPLPKLLASSPEAAALESEDEN